MGLLNSMSPGSLSPLPPSWRPSQHQAMASDLPFYHIFAFTKNSSLEVSDDVIACDLWFGPPPIKIPGFAYEIKRMRKLQTAT